MLADHRLPRRHCIPNVVVGDRLARCNQNVADPRRHCLIDNGTKPPLDDRFFSGNHACARALCVSPAFEKGAAIVCARARLEVQLQASWLAGNKSNAVDKCQVIAKKHL